MAGHQAGSGNHAGKHIAVIGSGISGLSAAWLLAKQHRVTVYEKEPRLGGHSHTVDVPCPEGDVPVDTGFIVYNERNYPNLTALFRHLGVATKASNMSFSASLDGGDFEYTGSVSGLFADRRNLFRKRMWRLLRDIPRLYRRAPSYAGDQALADKPLGEFLTDLGFSKPLRDDHLLPMCAAIWSLPRGTVESFPALSFLRFFDNHGLFTLTRRPKWRTVEGGSREYVARMAGEIGNDIRLGTGVARIERSADGVLVVDCDGRAERFDEVVIAAHSDEALAMLAEPTEAEARLLGAMPYQPNTAYLHWDESLMPRYRQVWASWNYVDGGHDRPVCVTYWMNRLQSLPTERQIFVTLNPSRPPAEDKTFTRYEYSHPVFDALALKTQAALWQLQGRNRTWYCGAYFGSGFHEDGIQAGLAVAEELGGLARPWAVEEASGRIQALKGASPSLQPPFAGVGLDKALA